MSAGLYAVVVTGARDWADGDAVWGMLNLELAKATRVGGDANFVIIHGACKTGADAIASKWCKQRREIELPMPAQWDEHGKAAGPIRNNQMALVARCLRDCGWTVTCHAFGLAQSKGGTKDCVKALEARDFNVTIHEASQ